MTLDDSMNKFRVAGRELFNNYFRVPSLSEDYELAVELEEGFNAVEQLLFEKLVLEPWSIPNVKYGYKFGAYPEIRVSLPIPNSDEGLIGDPDNPPLAAPIMLNREVDSGYWDYPLDRFTNDATLMFICYFDWVQFGFRDNNYVRVLVRDWPAHPDVVGKEGLVESYQVRFVLNE